eukprot:7387676-Prymnesium_polylepis.3
MQRAISGAMPPSCAIATWLSSESLASVKRIAAAACRALLQLGGYLGRACGSERSTRMVKVGNEEERSGTGHQPARCAHEL